MDEEYPDLATKNGKPRFDDKFHKKIRRIVDSAAFNGFIIFIIFMNALFMWLELEVSDPDFWDVIIDAVDYIFLGIYTIEFILKVYAHPKSYWRSAYNVFDFIVLAISLAQVFLELAQFDENRLGALRVLRALRTLRTLRTISFVRGLQVLVTALVDVIRKWVLNVMLLLVIIMFLFAIMGYYFFGYKEDGDKENWGDLGRAMLSLFSFTTADGWTDIQNVMDLQDEFGSRVFTIIYIVVGHFIFTNVFVGVIIMNISEATENYKREQIAERAAILKHKKEFMMMRQHNDVQQMLERQKKGHYANFQEMVKEFQKGLRHEDSEMMSDLSTNIIWLETYIRTLDHMDTTMYKVQQLHFEIANTLAKVAEEKLRRRYNI